MKKLYIFNDQDHNQRADFYESEISENVLWSGENWETFNQETGLSEKEIGGIVKLKDDKLVFNQEKYNTYLKSKLPLAMGKTLVSKVEKSFTGQPFEFRMQLQSLFLPLKATLESETCNPLSVNDFEFVFKFLDTLATKLTAEQITIFKNLLTEFVNENRFFDYNPEILIDIAKKLQS